MQIAERISRIDILEKMLLAIPHAIVLLDFDAFVEAHAVVDALIMIEDVAKLTMAHKMDILFIIQKKEEYWKSIPGSAAYDSKAASPHWHPVGMTDIEVVYDQCAYGISSRTHPFGVNALDQVD